jgi:hypothetical protein
MQLQVSQRELVRWLLVLESCRALLPVACLASAESEVLSRGTVHRLDVAREMRSLMGMSSASNSTLRCAFVIEKG